MAWFSGWSLPAQAKAPLTNPLMMGGNDTSAGVVSPGGTPAQPRHHETHHLHDGPADALMFTHFLCVGLHAAGEEIRFPDDSSGSPSDAGGVRGDRRRGPLAPDRTSGTTYDPELLFQWPEIPYSSPKLRVLNGIAGPKLARFAFPDGISVRQQTSAWRVRLASQLGGENTGGSVYTFRLFGEETGVMYGLCCVVDALLEEPLTFLDPADDVEKKNTASGTAHRLVAPRCFVLLTHHPFFSVHLLLLRAIVAEDLRARKMGRSSAESVRHILGHYAALAVPSEGSEYRLELPAEAPLDQALSLSFHRPAGQSYEDLLAIWSLVPVFNSVSLEHVLALFAALLTERQILVVGSDLSVVSALVLSVQPLFPPLAWQGLLIPVLPRNLHDMLMAPVPFVVGSPRMPSPESIPPDVVVMDLDRNRIFVTAGGAAAGTGAFSHDDGMDSSNVSTGAVPALPEAAKLRHNVRKEYAHLRSLTGRRKSAGQASGGQAHEGGGKFSASQEEMAAAFRILDAWQKYLRWLVAKVISFYRASQLDMTDMRQRDRVNGEFVSGVTGHNRDFVRQFTSTQFLTEYVSRSFREGDKHGNA